MNGEDTQEQQNELLKLLVDKIENLRPKLLDLSRRNPLVSTRLGPRGSTVIRVVDELPDVLSFSILGDQRMRFVPLPPLEEDPKDEESRQFISALSEARITDELYLSAVDAIDPNDEIALELMKQAERALKDRLRERLGMPPHGTTADITMAQHAKNNGISPSYDLPLPHQEHEDGRHTDTDIQTLLLPDDLERKLTAILTKCRTWIQETGINVLHAAFGFLEWKEPNGQVTCFAPLVLAPVEVEKIRTRDGAEFWVRGLGEDAETNLVLAEKLKLDFGIELPVFDGGSIEEYLTQIAENSPPNLQFRVRRQVVFGVFPSARMAMYHDLDTNAHAFGENEIIQGLLVGSEDSGASPFADEYMVDEPEVEKKVPSLVLDADSSQFSTLVDVADDKNVALEGPPGTGKSQTIVNAIACALADGKKVLFVAEKMAALEVVKSRLEAVGLGEFVLPLQAERSTKEQVIQSIRSRVDMTFSGSNQDFETKIERYRKYRSELAAYVQALSSDFGESGLSVFQILGRGIATRETISLLPRDIQKIQIENIERFSQTDLQIATEVSERLATAWQRARNAQPYWKDHSLQNLDNFLVEDLCEAAEDAATVFSDANTKLEALRAFGLAKIDAGENVGTLIHTLEALTALSVQSDAGLIRRMIEGDCLQKLDRFVADCDRYTETYTRVERFLQEPENPIWDSKLNRIDEICAECNFASIDSERINGLYDSKLAELNSRRDLLDALQPFMEAVPTCKEFPLQKLRAGRSLVANTPNNALALRSEILGQHETAIVVREARDIAEQLKREQTELKNAVSTKAQLGSDELRRYAAVIGQSGRFSFLSSQFREAKKAYNTICIRPSFNKDYAFADMRYLADWQDEHDKFLAMPNIQNVFGGQFRGLDTDFGLIAAVIEYYEKVEAEFPGIENIGIRSFLRSADIETLIAIPEIDVEDWDGTFADLDGEIAALAQFEEKLRERTVEITSLLAQFELKVSGTPQVIRDLRADCQEIRNERTRLNEQAEIRDLLRDKFMGADTASSTFDGSKQAANTIKQLPESLHAPVVDIIQTSRLAECLLAARKVLDAARAAEAALTNVVELSGLAPEHFQHGNSYRDVAEFLRAAANDKDGLYAYAEQASAKAAYVACGLPELVDLLEAYDVFDCDLVKVTEALIARNLSRQVFQVFGNVLSHYNGERLDDLRKRLASTDRELIRLSRQLLRQKFSRSAAPPGGNRIGKKSTWTEWALIENEINKKKRYVPIRDLTNRAGKALQELKPCWMMSPLAVAQYLRKGGIRFDLCIIDEASQMPPEDAIGALARCSKALVVGDTNQLPPTSFFRRMIDDEDADEDETVLEESVLELANAAFRPKRRLRWHYRSRHSGLIRFSNRLIYDDDLIVFPSAHEDRNDMGVSYVKVDGSYKAGVNGIEASAIIDAVMDFMYHNPDRSLGVVTLNQKQRDLIIEELEYVLRKSPWATKYIDDWKERNDGLESFFVKNLENVQGDERDVIFIGTVYGPSESGGPVMQRFGPINGLAGQRRLNVLFSRAKEQIVTFSSMTASDIRADEHGNPGTYMLKRWLEYSATGVLDSGSETRREPDSDFEAFVIDQIQAMGCEAIPQVGVAGYFIDIGVRHPEWPHGFVLGVECDGASYHSSKSARDRDRLRQEVLENLGWHFHRIWSTDWFNDPLKEIARLREKIAERVDELKNDIDIFSPAPAKDVEVDQNEEPSDVEPQLELEHSQMEVGPNPDGIAVGDRVRVRYMSGSGESLEFVLTDQINDPDNGLVSVHEPLGEALIDVEEGEDVEFLVGSYVRRVIVEKVEKSEDVPQPSARQSVAPIPSPPSGASTPTIAGMQKDRLPFEASQSNENTSPRLSPDRFYDDDYIFVIRRVGLETIDRTGPITLRHLSARIARMHGFQRTGSQIRKTVWAAVSKDRKFTKGPNGENIFWPKDVPPETHIPFRGLLVEGDERPWKQVPYPEKLGLALEVVNNPSTSDKVESMARKIGLARIAQKTRDELTTLLKQAEET